MTESHCRAMMRLIDNEIMMLRSREGAASPTPFKIEYGLADQTLQEATSIEIVSFNILSDALFNSDYYRKSNGEINLIDENERKNVLTRKSIHGLGLEI